MRSTVGGDIAVRAEQVEAIPAEPGGKVRAVISHCRDRAAQAE
jgi:hypothetical protein